MEFLPYVLVFVLPCARFPNSFPNMASQIYLVVGSLINVLYFKIVSPLIRCTSSTAKCTKSVIPCLVVFVYFGVSISVLVSYTFCVSIFTPSCNMIFAMRYSGEGVYEFVGFSVMVIIYNFRVGSL